ncbi:hypothetical protein C485_07532 [Natrinema altunense JCM 12890]|uniref:Envelope protein N-terminal domain-containing protein n=1 Tax=Natrinema altunense (strain JCM 12890 / CGMCC 1.3731 / AJ2) TaxID=1227494 RepID=L9ZL25_NATA2|nr:hypothetical protein C485_07532 [Natrinema altunense JCM 12890]
MIEVDVHTGAQAIYQGQQQRDSVYQNYLEDTETLASLEARNAIATAYENNKTAIEAQAAGQKAINDYYAHHQRQNLEMLAADSAEIAYYHNVTDLRRFYFTVVSEHDGHVDVDNRRVGQRDHGGQHDAG